MLNEFREFIAKGNVMDLAVGVIIGAAFQRIVDSLVNDLVMPVAGLALGGADFTNLFVTLKEGAKAPGPVRVAGRGQGGRRRRARLRRLHQSGGAVPDSRVGRFPDRQGGQQTAQELAESRELVRW